MTHTTLAECCYLEKGATPIQKAIPGDYPMVVTATARKTSSTYQFDSSTVCIPLVSSRGHGVASLNQVFYQEGKFALGNILCGVTPKDSNSLDAKFLYYLLNYTKDWSIVPLMTGGANVSLTVKTLAKVKVSYPPLAIQQEIVKILDKFTSLIDKIDEEINLRQKQYEYYREKLLTPSNSPQGGEWEWKKLGEVATFRYGFTDKAQDVGNVRYIRITDITNDGLLQKEDAKYLNLNNENESYLLKKGDLLMARTGATYGKTLYFDSEQPSIYASFLIKIDFKDKEIEPRYYWIFSKSSIYWNQASKLVGGGAQPQFNANAIAEVLVPLPPKAQQHSIVQTLDKFETLISQLKEERALRQKQYEYYREKLLTF